MVNNRFVSTTAQSGNGYECTGGVCVCVSFTSVSGSDYGHLKFRASLESERRDYSSASDIVLLGGALALRLT